MSYSKKFNLFFIHIPKNAGTSICNSIQCPHGHHHSLQCIDKIKFPTALSFAIVRNPWDRMVSIYRYYKMEKSYWHSTDNSTQFNITNTHHKVKKLSFKEFVHAVHAKQINDIHLQPQYQFICKNDKVMIDYVFYFEQDISEQMKDKLNIDIDVLHQNISNESNISYKDYYDDETKEIVRKIYSKDVDIFKYQF